MESLEQIAGSQNHQIRPETLAACGNLTMQTAAVVPESEITECRQNETLVEEPAVGSNRWQREQYAVTNKAVSSCLKCIARRHPDNLTEVAVQGKVIAQCLDMSPQRVTASLARLSHVENPPVTRERRGQPFYLTAAAAKIDASVSPPSCQQIGYVPPSVPLETPRLQHGSKLAIRDRVIAACVEDIKNPDLCENAVQALKYYIVRGYIGPTRTKIHQKPEAPGYADRGSWVHFAVGKVLSGESESMQKTLVHHLGLDRIIYGERLDEAVLHKELCLEPTDSLEALAVLLIAKLDYIQSAKGKEAAAKLRREKA